VADSQFYQFKIGQRPVKVESKTDLEQGNWHVDWELAASM